jgi:Immunity protein 53
MPIEISQTADPFEFLSEWYESHCDGIWEHQYGVEISTIDNPGWSIAIDLVGTELAKSDFSTITSDAPGSNWYHCRKVGERFESACGPASLRDVLKIFANWASQESR